MKADNKSRFQHGPQGQRLPIKPDNTTNGEYLPAGLSGFPRSSSSVKAIRPSLRKCVPKFLASVQRGFTE